MKKIVALAVMLVLAAVLAGTSAAGGKKGGGGACTAHATVTTDHSAYIAGQTAIVSWSGACPASQLEVICSQDVSPFPNHDVYGTGQIKTTNGETGQFFMPLSPSWAIAPDHCTASVYSYPQHALLGSTGFTITPAV